MVSTAMPYSSETICQATRVLMNFGLNDQAFEIAARKVRGKSLHMFAANEVSCVWILQWQLTLLVMLFVAEKLAVCRLGTHWRSLIPLLRPAIQRLSDAIT